MTKIISISSELRGTHDHNKQCQLEKNHYHPMCWLCQTVHMQSTHQVVTDNIFHPMKRQAQLNVRDMITMSHYCEE